MLQSFLNGQLVMASLIVAIGAQNAFLLGQSLRREHPLLVAGICALSDAVLVCAGVFGLATVLLQNPTLLATARWGGTGFLLWYGSKALWRSIHPQVLRERDGARGTRRVVLTTLAVTLLNPHVYLDTVLLVGSLGARQAQPAAYAIGACCSSFIWFFGLAFGASRLAPWLARPLTWRIIDLAVAATMYLVALQLLLGE
jgi:L-lysine exporter family protein LysE/ArgO